MMIDVNKERELVGLALPAHMMYLMYEGMRDKGYEIRADVLHNLNIACLKPFKDLDEMSTQLVAKRTDDHATALLRAMSPDDPRHGLLDVCAFVLLLVDEKRISPDQQAVLVALALIDEFRHDGADWAYSEKKAYTRGSSIMTRAFLLGYYASNPLQSPLLKLS